MLGLILTTLFITTIVAGFLFSKTSKEMPKSWYEWKTEFRYQFIGMAGLYDDFTNRSRNQVALRKQPGRIAIITGGNRGIGLRIVDKLLACDITVIMGVRDPDGARKAVETITNLKDTKGQLVCEKLDVGDLTSVKEFANKIKAKYDKIDILINNAGIMFAPFKLTADGYESHFAINYLGHFLLTHLVMHQLKAAGRKGQNARIINVSSCVNLIGRINYNDINGQKYYYPGTAYAQSKLAQILFTRALQKQLDEENAHVKVYAVHPGIVDTDLFEHSATTSVPLFKKIFFKTPEEGSRTVVYSAIDPQIEEQGGIYISNCGKGPMNPVAKNPQICEKLFNFTCELLKIQKYGNVEL